MRSAGIKPFPAGGGEMGERIRAFDWSRTPLGPIALWPQSLRNALSMALLSRAQIVLFWGPELVALYNDAYAPVLGSKHPEALGKPARECWSEIWEVLHPLFAGVLESGEAYFAKDRLFLLERHGFLEETYFDVSCDPVEVEDGAIGGLRCIVSETSGRVLGERRLRTLRDLGAETAKAKSADDACTLAAAALAANPHDLPFAAAYLLNGGSAARLACATGSARRTARAPEVVELEGDGPWPLRRVLETRAAVEAPFPNDGGEPVGVWPEPPARAVVLPLPKPGTSQLAGFLVAGVSPRLALGDDYQAFLDLLAAQIANAIAGADAYDALADSERAEEALRASEERFRAIVESQVEMVCRFRRDGTILFANSAYAQALGSTPEAVVGRNFWNLIPEANRPEVERMLDALSPAAPEASIENFLKGPDGERWTLWTNRALKFDVDGRLLEAQSAGIDITQRKRMEEALRRSDRRKDELLATLAHELRNPLAPLRNGLEVLRRAGRDNGAAEQARAMMERQIALMVRLIDDLLDVSRISRGKITLRKEAVELAPIVRQAVESCRPVIDQAGHRLTILLPREPIHLEADPARLAQVFSNLLDNAAKFTEPGGHLRLTIERYGGEVVVSVRDNGVGIPRESLAEVFDLFVQVDRSVERAHGGLGIGLSLVKALTELHGGNVEARSDGPGTGCELVVRLPVSVTRVVERQRHEAQPGRAAPYRILVVDDNRDSAASTSIMLEAVGNETRTAYDGVTALTTAASFRPDVILLDIGMPRLNGYEVARRIREQPWGQGITLVAVTGWGQEEDRRRSREAGFDFHLVKPVALSSLEQVLAQVKAVSAS